MLQWRINQGWIRRCLSRSLGHLEMQVQAGGEVEVRGEELTGEGREGAGVRYCRRDPRDTTLCRAGAILARACHLENNPRPLQTKNARGVAMGKERAMM